MTDLSYYPAIDGTRLFINPTALAARGVRGISIVNQCASGNLIVQDDSGRQYIAPPLTEASWPTRNSLMLTAWIDAPQTQGQLEVIVSDNPVDFNTNQLASLVPVGGGGGLDLAAAVLAQNPQGNIALTGTEAAPNDILSVTYTANGTDVVVVEAVLGAIQFSVGFAVGDSIGFNLWVDGVDTGRLWSQQAQQNGQSITIVGESVQSGRFVPVSGVRTMKIRGWKIGAGTAAIFYGVGGTGINQAGSPNPAITMRIMKVA